MTKLVWAPDPRYELGVDRGVLKLGTPGGTGVVAAWNGLISVDEQVQGGERTDNTFDGTKHSESIATRNWQGLVRAYSWPEWAYAILGYGFITSGFYIARQPRKSFTFSYRTMVGESNYKLHIVYNATILNSQPSRKTLSDTPDPDILEWTINAVPPDVSGLGIKPTSHFVVESSKANPSALTVLEDMIYGTDTVNTKFPTVAELIDILNG